MADYKYIRAWGRMVGSYQSYIDYVLEKARREGAPENTVYLRHDGKWATMDDVKSEDAKYTIRCILEEMGLD